MFKTVFLTLFIPGIAMASITSFFSKDFFKDPARLCGAMASNGLKTDGWKHGDDTERYACAAWRDVTENAIEGIWPSQISYRVEGPGQGEAESLALTLNVKDHGSREQGVAMLKADVKALLKAIGEPMPDGLAEAMDASRHFIAKTSYGHIVFVHGQGKPDSMASVDDPDRYAFLVLRTGAQEYEYVPDELLKK